MSLLPRPVAEKFGRDYVYLRGVAESEPIEIYYTKELTSIPAAHREPIDPAPGKPGAARRTDLRVEPSSTS
jgi:hypothetical protein